MSGSKILFNASNLHVGGGVQVAVSIITEWIHGKIDLTGIDIWVSSEIHQNLVKTQINVTSLQSYRVVNTYGASILWSKIRYEFEKYLVIYTLYGPFYSLNRNQYNIVGFAQAWLLEYSEPLFKEMSLFRRTYKRLFFSIQKFFFRRSNILVVEHEYLVRHLEKSGIANKESVLINRNCVSSIYLNKNLWSTLNVVVQECNDSCKKIAYLGRNYPHKNTKILPYIAKELKAKYNCNIMFYVTFTDAEWKETSDFFKAHTINVGELYVHQCPTYFDQMDAVIFPSRLECFSATPLEALMMGKILFASDMDFNREICGNHAIYFDHENPTHASDKIHQCLFLQEDGVNAIDERINHALAFSNPQDRAMKTYEILKNHL